MTEEKVYRKHEIMCEVAEAEGDAFTMTFTAIEMDKPNSFKTGFKDYAELKGLANYILESLAPSSIKDMALTSVCGKQRTSRS